MTAAKRVVAWLTVRAQNSKWPTRSGEGDTTNQRDVPKCVYRENGDDGDGRQAGLLKNPGSSHAMAHAVAAGKEK